MTKVISRGAASLHQVTRSKRQLNLKFFNLGLLAIITGLGFCYLINISDLTVKGFALQDLKTQANYLAEDTINQKEEIDSLQSYYALNTQAAQLDMVAVGDIEYVEAPISIVAKR